MTWSHLAWREAGKYSPYLLWSHVCVKLLQSCLTLWNPMDGSPPSSSVHGTLEARILEWVAIPFFRRSSRTRDRTHVSCVSWIGRQVRYHWATGEALGCTRLSELEPNTFQLNKINAPNLAWILGSVFPFVPVSLCFLWLPHLATPNVLYHLGEVLSACLVLAWRNNRNRMVLI